MKLKTLACALSLGALFGCGGEGEGLMGYAGRCIDLEQVTSLQPR